MTNAFRHPSLTDRAGKRKAAKAPPTGTPVCLKPIAMDLRLSGNHAITTFEVAGLIAAWPTPAKKSKIQIRKKESARLIEKIKVPTIN